MTCTRYRSVSLVALSLLALAGCGSSMLTDSGGGTGGAAGGAEGTGGAATASGGSGPNADCPEGAFVSLTYDDALSSQVLNAIPALDAHGLKATFFLTDVRANLVPWSGLAPAGHEVAAHTLKHPCPKANSWVPVGQANEDYDLARMATELDESVAMVESLGQAQPFTFAYPCGISWVGEDHTSYVPLVQERFAGARGVVGSVITTLADPYNVPAYFLTGDGPALIAVVNQAVAAGGWVVFGFHGVGGDFSEVTTEAHEALLSHLEAEAVPVLTFAAGLACKKP